jgi:ribonuclease HI
VPHITHHCRELQAIIQGFVALHGPCQVERSPDSDNVLTRLNGSWARQHHKSVQRLQAAAIHQVTPHDVRGHAGHPENERVDAFAPQAASTGVGSGGGGWRSVRGRGLTCHRAAIWVVAIPQR